MALSIAGVLFDIDGTILRGARMLPFVCETIQQLRARKIKVCFFTNDNRAPVEQWLGRLHSHGIVVGADEVITSAIVAAEMVAQWCPTGNILVAGDVGLREALQAHDLRLIDWDSTLSADLVVMGKDPDFDQKRLQIVCQHIWNGAKFVATNNDRKMPVADGYVPGTGAMVQAVAYATGTQPLVTGKPSIHAANVALEGMGLSAEHVAIVGDSLTSDIKLGKTAGMTTILVLTGTHGWDDVYQLPPEDRPDHVLNDLSDLPLILLGENL
ncbi:MAG: HAD-IIA family hydrolase [Ardenticatenaceae bacterium]